MKKQEKINFNFYTETNFCKLPLFTASKKVKTNKEKETILFSQNKIEKKLIIEYAVMERKIKKEGKTQIIKIREKATYKDSIVLKALEFLFYKNDFNELKKEYQKEEDIFKNKYIKDFNIKNRELTINEEQQIIYQATKIIRERYSINFELSTINNLLTDSYNHKSIQESLEKLKNTFIYAESNYKVGKNDVLKFNKIPVIDYTLNTTEKSHKYILTLNPFHLYNLIHTVNITDSDFKTITQLKSYIAIGLYDKIKLRFWGKDKRDKSNNTITFDYDEICELLLLEKRKKFSLIKQQLKTGFNELIKHNVIVNYTIEKTLFKNTYLITFYKSIIFYKDFWQNTPSKTRNSHNKKLLLLKENDKEKYAEFEQKLNDELNKIDYPEIKEDTYYHYIRYYVFVEYFLNA